MDGGIGNSKKERGSYYKNGSWYKKKENGREECYLNRDFEEIKRKLKKLLPKQKLV